MTETPLSPYQMLPDRAFWRTAVSARDGTDLRDLYQPKFRLAPGAKIMTAGSCFAQHLGRALIGSGFNVIRNENLNSSFAEEVNRRYSYGIYSARYGNIYTCRHLLQLLLESRGKFSPAEPVWERNGRFFDSQRPSVEPEGLDSPEQVLLHRKYHLAQVRRTLGAADVIVFTLGLTEAWMHRETNTVYPMAPGIIAGQYDPKLHVFKNFNVNEIRRDFVQFRAIMKKSKPDLKFLLTVSPVALAATASGQHVEVANTYSKCTLRTVAGLLCEEFDDIDYIPTYELLNSRLFRGNYFTENLRQITPEGVAAAMALFLEAQMDASIPPETDEATQKVTAGIDVSDEQCDDALLESFAR